MYRVDGFGSLSLKRWWLAGFVLMLLVGLLLLLATGAPSGSAYGP